MTQQTTVIDAEVTTVGTENVYSQPVTVAENGGDPAVRDKMGRFAPGSKMGRSKRADERAIISAMDKALPPTELELLLKEAIGWAREYKSPKLVLSIAQFVVSYQIGAPVQRSITASGKLESLIERLGSMDEDEFERIEQAMRVKE